jgi:hypothetical protein
MSLYNGPTGTFDPWIARGKGFDIYELFRLRFIVKKANIKDSDTASIGKIFAKVGSKKINELYTIPYEKFQQIVDGLSSSGYTVETLDDAVKRLSNTKYKETESADIKNIIVKFPKPKSPDEWQYFNTTNREWEHPVLNYHHEFGDYCKLAPYTAVRKAMGKGEPAKYFYVGENGKLTDIEKSGAYDLMIPKVSTQAAAYVVTQKYFALHLVNNVPKDIFNLLVEYKPRQSNFLFYYLQDLDRIKRLLLLNKIELVRASRLLETIIDNVPVKIPVALLSEVPKINTFKDIINMYCRLNESQDAIEIVSNEVKYSIFFTVLDSEVNVQGNKMLLPINFCSSLPDGNPILLISRLCGISKIEAEIAWALKCSCIDEDEKESLFRIFVRYIENKKFVKMLIKDSTKHESLNKIFSDKMIKFGESDLTQDMVMKINRALTD